MTKMQLLILSILGLVVLAICMVAGMLIAAQLPAAPTAIPGPTPTPTVLTFMGQSDDFFMFQNPKPGLAVFAFAHRGKGLFAVELVGEGLLAIETGEYDGQTTHPLEAGEYVVNVTADGPWMVVVGLPQ